MNASDVMTAGAITIGPDANVQSAAKTMLEKGVSALPVVDQGGKLIGIISEGDLIRRTESGTEEKPSWWLRLVSGTDTLASSYVKAHGIRVADVMSGAVVTATPDTSLAEIARSPGEEPHQARADRERRQGRRHRQPRQSAAGAGQRETGLCRNRGGKRLHLARQHPGAPVGAALGASGDDQRDRHQRRRRSVGHGRLRIRSARR